MTQLNAEGVTGVSAGHEYEPLLKMIDLQRNHKLRITLEEFTISQEESRGMDYMPNLPLVVEVRTSALNAWSSSRDRIGSAGRTLVLVATLIVPSVPLSAIGAGFDDPQLQHSHERADTVVLHWTVSTPEYEEVVCPAVSSDLDQILPLLRDALRNCLAGIGCEVVRMEFAIDTNGHNVNIEIVGIRELPPSASRLPAPKSTLMILNRDKILEMDLDAGRYISVILPDVVHSCALAALRQYQYRSTRSTQNRWLYKYLFMETTRK
jgi:hypothetical protein